MVQEVQTGIWIANETTLETIEAVGTSSFKIVEWRQTKWGHYVSKCSGNGNVTWHYVSPNTTSPEIESTDLTITSNVGKAEFVMRNGGIRLPAQWTYQITISRGAAGNANGTMILKVWGKEVYRTLLYHANSTTDTIIADAGKFDTIEMWGQFEYVGSASSASIIFSPQPQITIQQL